MPPIDRLRLAVTNTSLFELAGVLFDLDGVLTSTAALHAAAWKATFDPLLQELPGADMARQRPFGDEDYRRYVDGRPRSDGVRGFLASRNISLPEGDPDDPPSRLTVAGVARLKNRLFQHRLATGDIAAFPGSVALLRRLRARGLRTAVVSASRNCRAVLEAAGIDGLFDVRIDGEVAASRGLRGKPAPDTFLAAARELGIAPSRAAVIEDAIAGVEAGRAGGFGLVIGVARTGAGRELLEHGADRVVGDLAELLDSESGEANP